MYSMSPGLGLGSQGAPGAPFSPRLGASAAGPGVSPPFSPRPGEQIQETGVGVLLVEGPEGKVIVGKLMPGGPAEAAGLRVGDTVISVQGHRTWSGIDELVDMIVGPEGSTVAMQLQRGQTTMEKTVRRSRTVFSPQLNNGAPTDPWESPRPSSAHGGGLRPPSSVGHGSSHRPPSLVPSPSSISPASSAARMPSSAAPVRAPDGAADQAEAAAGARGGVGDSLRSSGSVGGVGGGAGVGMVLKRVNKRVIIGDVVVGGEAEDKGLQVGDEVMLVDGQSVANLTPTEVVRIIVGPPDTTVSVLIKRDGGMQRKTLKRRLPASTGRHPSNDRGWTGAGAGGGASISQQQRGIGGQHRGMKGGGHTNGYSSCDSGISASEGKNWLDVYKANSMKDVKSLQREQSPSPSLRSGAAGVGGDSSASGGEGMTRSPSEGGIVHGRAQGRNLQRSPSSDKRQRPAGGIVQRRQEGGINQGRSPPGGEISRSSSASTAPVAMGGAAAAGGLRRGGIARSSSSRSPPPPAVRGRGVGVPLELMRAPPPARHLPPNPSLPTAAHSRAPPVLPSAAPLVTRLGDLTSPASNASAQQAVVGVPVQSITAAATVAAPPSSSHPPVRPPPASPEGAVAKAANLLRRIGSWKSALSPGGPSSTPERTNSVSGSEPRATNPPPFTPTGAGLPRKGSSDEVEDRGAEGRPVPTDKTSWRYPERDAPPPSAPSPGKLPGFWMSRGRGVDGAEAVPWTGGENLSAAGILDTIESVPSSGQGQESQVFTRDSARSSTVQSSTNATARSHAKLDAKQQGDVSVSVFEGEEFVARENQESGLRGRGEASVQSRRSMYVERAIMGIERRRHCRMFRDWKQAVHPPPAQPRRHIAKIPDQDVEAVKQNVFTGWRIQSVWSFYVDQAMAQIHLGVMAKCFDSWKSKSVQFRGVRHLQKAISDKVRLRCWLCWRRIVLHGMYIRLATERSEAEYNLRLMKRTHGGWLGASLDSAHCQRVDSALRQRLRRNMMLAAFKEMSSNLYRMLHLGFCETKIAQRRLGMAFCGMRDVVARRVFMAYGCKRVQADIRKAMMSRMVADWREWCAIVSLQRDMRGAAFKVYQQKFKKRCIMLLAGAAAIQMEENVCQVLSYGIEVGRDATRELAVTALRECRRDVGQAVELIRRLRVDKIMRSCSLMRGISSMFSPPCLDESQVMDLLARHQGSLNMVLNELLVGARLAEAAAMDVLRFQSVILGAWAGMIRMRRDMQRAELSIMGRSSRSCLKAAAQAWKGHTVWKRHIHWGGAELSLRFLLRLRARYLACWRSEASCRAMLRARGEQVGEAVSCSRRERSVKGPLHMWRIWRRYKHGFRAKRREAHALWSRRCGARIFAAWREGVRYLKGVRHLLQGADHVRGRGVCGAVLVSWWGDMQERKEALLRSRLPDAPNGIIMRALGEAKGVERKALLIARQLVFTSKIDPIIDQIDIRTVTPKWQKDGKISAQKCEEILEGAYGCDPTSLPWPSDALSVVKSAIQARRCRILTHLGAWHSLVKHYDVLDSLSETLAIGHMARVKKGTLVCLMHNAAIRIRSRLSSEARRLKTLKTSVSKFAEVISIRKLKPIAVSFHTTNLASRALKEWWDWASIRSSRQNQGKTMRNLLDAKISLLVVRSWEDISKRQENRGQREACKRMLRRLRSTKRRMCLVAWHSVAVELRRVRRGAEVLVWARVRRDIARGLSGFAARRLGMKRRTEVGQQIEKRRLLFDARHVMGCWALAVRWSFSTWLVDVNLKQNLMRRHFAAIKSYCDHRLARREIEVEGMMMWAERLMRGVIDELKHRTSIFKLKAFAEAAAGIVRMQQTILSWHQITRDVREERQREVETAQHQDVEAGAAAAEMPRYEAGGWGEATSRGVQWVEAGAMRREDARVNEVLLGPAASAAVANVRVGAAAGASSTLRSSAASFDISAQSMSRDSPPDSERPESPGAEAIVRRNSEDLLTSLANIGPTDTHPSGPMAGNEWTSFGGGDVEEVFFQS